MPVAVDAGDADDPAPALLDHPRQGLLHQLECWPSPSPAAAPGREDVHREVLDRDTCWNPALLTRIAAGGRPRTCTGSPQVADHRLAGDLAGEPVQGLLVEVDSDDVSAKIGKPPHARRADPARRTGHQGQSCR
jgi:hypothetical protein